MTTSAHVLGPNSVCGNPTHLLSNIASDPEMLECSNPALGELASYNRWVVWEHQNRHGKWTKVPLAPSFGIGPRSRAVRPAATNAPATWASFDTAHDSAHATPGGGLGFVLAEEDPFLCIDIDHCISGGVITPWAEDIINFVGSYTEISPSGSGVHIWCRGVVPGRQSKLVIGNAAVEFYDKKRYMTVTGNHLASTPLTINDAQPAIEQVYAMLFSHSPKAHLEVPATGATATISTSDQSVLEQCRQKAGFNALFDQGNLSAYGNDHSKADFALCCRLAESTRDAQQIERLVGFSALSRDKWRTRQDYRAATVANALKKVPATTSVKSPSDAKKGDGPPAPSLQSIFEDRHLVHDSQNSAYAKVPLKRGLSTLCVQSEEFREWLRFRAYKAAGSVPSKTSLDDHIATFNARAVHEGSEVDVGLRIAQVPDGLFVDLADDQNRAVHVTATGWSVVQDPPVHFLRPAGMAPLPVPELGGSLDEFRKLVNVPDDISWTLMCGWMVGVFNPSGPYAVLAVNGGQGSAKTTLCNFIRELTDPNRVPLRSLSRKEQDLVIAASNSHLLAFDNVSFIDDTLSDALCRISTGSDFATRKLYTDSGEKLFMATRPIIFNGIEESATRADFLERTLTIDLPPMQRGSRKTIKSVREKFEAAKPRLLGALMSAVSAALANRAQVMLDNLPRMADFVTWVTAAAPALGWGPSTFLDAMTANQKENADLAIDADRVAIALKEMMEHQPKWSGNSKSLMDTLTLRARDPVDDRLPQHWPQTPKNINNRVRKLVEPLKSQGIEVKVVGKKNGGRERMVTITNHNYTPPTP